MTLRVRADGCTDLPSMENWLNAGTDWTEHHGIDIAPSTTSAAELFYETGTQISSTTADTASLFETLQKEPLTTHPFLKLDALELCKESNPVAALLVRSGSSSMVDSSSNEAEDLSDQHVASSGANSLPSTTSLLDRTPNYEDLNLYMEADSPRGPLSPAALQLGKSPRTTGAKRPFDDLHPYSPFVAMANSAPPATTYLPPGNVATVPGILYPAPLTLPNVPSMEEIAQSRPKRRNVKISTDPQSVAARHRRERISDRVRVLQHFVPGGTKMDTASMLDEAIHYVKFLQQQLQALERLGNSYDPRFGGNPVMNHMSQVGNNNNNNSSSNSSVRPFDLNCAVYQTFPMQSTTSQQVPQNTTTWPTTSPGFGSQCFPDSPQEQFCH